MFPKKGISMQLNGNGRIAIPEKGRRDGQMIFESKYLY